MENGDVTALVRAYENGLYSFQELAAKLLDWADTQSLDQLTADLPEPVCGRFMDLLRKLYDNDLAAEAFVSLHKDGHIEAEKLATIRAWISRQR